MPPRTHRAYLDGVLESETPFTLAEEIQADATEYFKQIALDMVGGLPWPTDIDEFRTRYDPSAALDALMVRKGLNPNSLSPSIKRGLALFMEFAFLAATFTHSKVPGGEGF